MSSKPPNEGSGTLLPLEVLSSSIAKDASVISQYLGAHHLPQPSFSRDGPSNIISNDAPQNVRQALQHLVGVSLEMLHLAIGPSGFLPNLATSFQYVSCVSWLCQYDIFHLVPLNGTISYVDLAKAAHVPEQRLKSIIRMAMTDALFCEQPSGKDISHSATTALLARNSDVHAWASYMCANTAPMAMNLAAAHRRWGPDSTRSTETAYNAAFDTDLPFFEHIARDDAKVREFASYMPNVTTSEGVDLKHLVSGFCWKGIRKGGVVVDVGGSTGNAAITLAKVFPHLNFLVQDLPLNADNGRKSATMSLPAELSSRITFQSHDFFQPQPVQGANVYLLRMILHDWPDDQAVEILRHIAAAMDSSDSRLLIMDSVLPTPGSVPVSVERIVRARDLTMMQAFNSKERDLEDWKSLLYAADSKLKLLNVVQPFGSDMSTLEVALDLQLMND